MSRGANSNGGGEGITYISSLYTLHNITTLVSAFWKRQTLFVNAVS